MCVGGGGGDTNLLVPVILKVAGSGVLNAFMKESHSASGTIPCA